MDAPPTSRGDHDIQNTVELDGGSADPPEPVKRTARSRKWAVRRQAAHEAAQRLIAQRKELIGARRWLEDAKFVAASSYTVVCRIKYGAESHLRKLWAKLCTQYRTNDEETLARRMHEKMARDRTSCVYHLINFNVNISYVGMVEARPAMLRAREHTIGIYDNDDGYYFYERLRRVARAEEWFLVPIISCEAAVPKRQLAAMEAERIQHTKECVNVKKRFYSREDRGLPRRRHKAQQQRREQEQEPRAEVQSMTRSARQSEVRLEAYSYAGVWALTCCLVACLDAAFFAFHSSCVPALPLNMCRKLRSSVVHIRACKPAYGEFVGTLGGGIRWLTRQRPPVWVTVQFIERKTRTAASSLRFDALSIMVRNERVMKDLIPELDVWNLYELWRISTTLIADEVKHSKNVKLIKAALRSRGFTATPTSTVVCRLPAALQVRIGTMLKYMRLVWSRSYVDPQVTQWFFNKLRFVRTAAQPLGRALDTTKKWISAQHFPCTCWRYPSSWPRRHGHICVPSWKYNGYFKETLRCIMNCKVRAGCSAAEVYQCVTETWHRYFPNELLPRLPPFTVESATADWSPLNITEVTAAASYLQYLVIMAIDKCRNRKLIVCPALFEQLYCQTFPAKTDSTHYRHLRMKEPEFVAHVYEVYCTEQWWRFGSWYGAGRMPTPYPMYKLKDLLVDCSEVFEKKGKCCRCRPILPNSSHWMRRVYRRVGAVLRLVVASLPDSAITMMKTVDLVKVVAEWDTAAPQHAKCAKWTGDISNCYDELQHKHVLQAVQWALAQLKEWLGRRSAVEVFSVNKKNRRDVRITRVYDTDDYVILEQQDILKVCAFDITHCVCDILGELYARTLGVPMGGFLSAFYAVLVLAYVEATKVDVLFTRLGMPGGIKRYLDDILICVMYSTAEELQTAQEMVDSISDSRAYPAPLCLNVEPEGDQEFLEAYVHGNHALGVRLLNKVADDVLAGNECYRQRLAGPTLMSTAEVEGLIAGIITRAVQCSLRPEDLFYAMVQLHVEVTAAGVKLNRLRKAAYRRVRKMEKLKAEPWRDAVRSSVLLWEEAREKGPL